MQSYMLYPLSQERPRPHHLVYPHRSCLVSIQDGIVSHVETIEFFFSALMQHLYSCLSLNNS